MTTLHFEVADRIRRVEIHPEGDAFRVVVDGRARLVHVVSVGRDAWSLIVSDADGAGGRSVEALVTPLQDPAADGRQNGAFDVHVGGYVIPVYRREHQRRSGHGATGSTGPQRLVAPMPGRVVRVLVSAGEAVKARQGLVVVEAMKMENELRAARDGRVRDVLVDAGQSVDAGTALVVID
ncbi:MAG: biotin/lipoyl-containing protein [Acidobacteriota bacterium]